MLSCCPSAYLVHHVSTSPPLGPTFGLISATWPASRFTSARLLRGLGGIWCGVSLWRRWGEAFGCRLGRGEGGCDDSTGCYCGCGPFGWPESVDERCRGGVAAVGGEHRGEDRDAEHPAQRVERVVGARCYPDVRERNGAGDGVGDGGEAHRDAHAGHDQRRDQGTVAHPGLGGRRQPAQTCRLQDQARYHEWLVADLVGECTGRR